MATLRRPFLLPLAAAALVVAGAGAAACGGDDGPPGSEAVDEPTEVGDCLRPDPERVDGLLQAPCDDAEAAVEVTAVAEADAAAATPGPACPAGTDEVVDARQGEVRDGEIAGAEQVWCLRNLDGPHPGDAGAGGGELVADDCFLLEEGGAVQEVRCGGSAPYRVLGWAGRTEDCPPDTTDPIELTAEPPEVVCAAATGAGAAATTPSVPPPTDPPTTGPPGA